MEIRSDEGTNRLFLDEISTVIVETTAVSITGCLIAELAKKNAETRLAEAKEESDIAIAKAKLMRALNRLNVAEK